MKFQITIDNREVDVDVSMKTNCWFDTFPLYINALRAAGFSISDDVKVYIPGALAETMNTKYASVPMDHLLFDSDLK